jgi:hypothetical protein
MWHKIEMRFFGDNKKRFEEHIAFGPGSETPDPGENFRTKSGMEKGNYG